MDCFQRVIPAGSALVAWSLQDSLATLASLSTSLLWAPCDGPAVPGHQNYFVCKPAGGFDSKSPKQYEGCAVGQCISAWNWKYELFALVHILRACGGVRVVNPLGILLEGYMGQTETNPRGVLSTLAFGSKTWSDSRNAQGFVSARTSGYPPKETLGVNKCFGTMGAVDDRVDDQHTGTWDCSWELSCLAYSVQLWPMPRHGKPD